MENPGLGALIGQDNLIKFFEDHWPKSPYFLRQSLTSVQLNREVPFLGSLAALAAAWPHSVQGHLPDVRDESSSVQVTPSDALKLYRNGMSLLFNNVHQLSPILHTWLQALHRDLGLPRSTHSRCMIYATPAGKGTTVHFDQNVNFVLQLHGRKTWYLAPNRTVENPTQRHTIGQKVDPELEWYTSSKMPLSMPADCEKLTLEPGSMLFVPRGYWHSTEATEDALALNYTFSQPTWADLLTSALRSRLLLSSDWRELADGVTSLNPARRESAARQFDLLVEELAGDLQHWSAHDVLMATEGEHYSP